MRIAGSAVVAAPRERVWEALVDPVVLGRALPGCRELEPVGADAYRLRVIGTVASLAGEYAGVVRVVERSRPEAVAFRGTGAGASGAVEGDVRLVLRADDDGSTRVEYDAEAEVDGALGAVGSRLLAAFGRRVAERFLVEIGAAVEAAVAGASPEPELQQGGTAASSRSRVALLQPSRSRVTLLQPSRSRVALLQSPQGWAAPGPPPPSRWASSPGWGWGWDSGGDGDPPHPHRHRHRRHVHRRGRARRGDRRARHHQDPVHARRPGRGLPRRDREGPRRASAVGGEAVAAVAHGTTVATNQLLEGRVGELGFVTTEGYRHVLEIARQSVPDGYGNSYFWVKPPRIVPVDRVRDRRRPARPTTAPRSARSTRSRPRPPPAGSATAASTRSASASCTRYANPDHEQRMRDVLAREHPDAVVSISSEVLREYREYERSVTTLVDAAVKPRIAPLRRDDRGAPRDARSRGACRSRS